MKEQIRSITKKLKISYFLFASFPVLLLLAGEFDVLPVGVYVDNGSMAYVLETVGILLTAGGVPLALKLFSMLLTKQVSTMPLQSALKRYVELSIFRLVILELVILFNLTGYYLTLSTTGSFCGIIGAIAFLFCIPSDRKLRAELQIDNE